MLMGVNGLVVFEEAPEDRDVFLLAHSVVISA